MKPSYSATTLRALEELMLGFNELAGFLGLAAYDSEDELITGHSPFGLGVEKSGPLLSGLFSGAARILAELDLAPPRLLHLETGDANLLVYSFGPDEAASTGVFRVVLMLEAPGSMGMAKLLLRRFARAAGLLLQQDQP